MAPDFVLSEMHRRAFAGDGSPLGKSRMQEEKIMTAEECAFKNCAGPGKPEAAVDYEL